MSELDDLLQQALNHHQQGRLEEAEQLYRAVLRSVPRHPEAHHKLGQLTRQRGQPRAALHHLVTAVSANPTVGQYWLSLVEALMECDEYAEAESVLADGHTLGLLEEAVVVEWSARLAAAKLAGEAPSPSSVPATRTLSEEEVSELQAASDAYNCGNLALALQKAQEVLARNPSSALAWALVANVHWNQGEYAAAEEAARRALDLEPAERNALLALALSLQGQGRYVESEATFRQALLAYPEDAEIYSNFSALLQEMGKWSEAQAAALRAIELRPTYADAWVNYGSALLGGGERTRAKNAYQAALQFNPQRVEALLSLGRMELGEHNFSQALDYYDKALALRPDFPEGLLGKAEVYLNLELFQEAESFARLALRKDPHHFAAYLDLALALAAQERDAEAEEVLQAARQCRPQPPNAAEQILAAQIQGRLWLPPILESQAAIAHWRARYQEGLRSLLALPGTLEDPTQLLGTSLSFYLAYHNADDRPLMEMLCQLFRAKAPQLNFEAPHVARWHFPAGRRIRVGFCSQFLVNHTIGKLYQGLLRQLDRSRFEVILIYPPQARRDSVRAMLEAACDRVVVLSGPLPQWQAQVAALELDALFYPDIGMSMATYFLAYARLAPVQMVSYGHPDTTGLDTIDYFLGADAPVEPEGAEAYYSERLVRFARLPFFYYQLFSLPRQIPPRAELGLPERGRLYGCPQSLFKFHPDFDAVLAAIAEGDPEGHIVLIDSRAKTWNDQLRARWAKSAPILNERVCFVPRQPLARFMALVAHCDVLLDPIHFGSGNSFYEPMAYGKPVVTWPGRFARARLVAAAYEQMGIAQIAPIAPSLDAYAATALAFGRDKERCLAFATKAVEAAKVHLYQDLQVVRQFETFLLAALEAAARGEKLPSGFRVPPPDPGS
ncbi:tetratricopeptide repeat protein [Synechococcus sp. H70.2]|uniref:tetratricopeptide repeat protein n=1 Tax=unclassified Synechococcus TaxID=2626047 RepID=UPI0039C30773